MQKKYPNLNRDSILAAFNRLSEGSLIDVYELLHKASVASGNAHAAQVKQGAGLLPGNTGSPGSGKASTNYKNIDEWVEAHQNAM